MIEILVRDIVWDGKAKSLPNMLIIEFEPDEIDLADDDDVNHKICEHLSSEFGYCVSDAKFSLLKPIPRKTPVSGGDIEIEYTMLVEDISDYGKDEALTELEVAEIAARVKDYIFDSYNRFIADACTAVVEERDG